jgi:hypothetical protein
MYTAKVYSRAYFVTALFLPSVTLLLENEGGAFDLV